MAGPCAQGLLVMTWLCSLGTACDRGYALRRMGTVDRSLICDRDAPDEQRAAAGCPPCSSAIESAGDGPRCGDRYYQSAWRCAKASDCGTGASCEAGYCIFTDLDRNGIDDAFEQEVAQRNLPEVRLHFNEDCGGPRAIVYRVQRHPDASRRLAITYVLLFDRDCGMQGHAGDREAFGITVDPDAAPGPGAVTGVITVAHEGTLCRSATTCETRPGTRGCVLQDGTEQVVIYSSRNKHANYFDPNVCGRNCFDDCELGQLLDRVLVSDVGSPEAPLTRDLSAPGGPIVAADGWRATLLHYDPWSDKEFGGGGRVRDTLTRLMAPAGLTDASLATQTASP